MRQPLGHLCGSNPWAGTSRLDTKSIFDPHIARGQRGGAKYMKLSVFFILIPPDLAHLSQGDHRRAKTSRACRPGFSFRQHDPIEARWRRMIPDTQVRVRDDRGSAAR